MNNYQFQQKLNSLHKAHKRYTELLAECEEEYTRRFGSSPSAVDDDQWIDACHITPLPMTVEEVTKNALFSNPNGKKEEADEDE